MKLNLHIVKDYLERHELRCRVLGNKVIRSLPCPEIYSPGQALAADVLYVVPAEDFPKEFNPKGRRIVIDEVERTFRDSDIPLLHYCVAQIYRHLRHNFLIDASQPYSNSSVLAKLVNRRKSARKASI